LLLIDIKKTTETYDKIASEYSLTINDEILGKSWLSSIEQRSNRGCGNHGLIKREENLLYEY